ncbi:hypothetical protein RCL1_005796 [Eukaryota sp. TZLM3-RCL]
MFCACGFQLSTESAVQHYVTCDFWKSESIVFNQIQQFLQFQDVRLLRYELEASLKLLDLEPVSLSSSSSTPPSISPSFVTNQLCCAFCEKPSSSNSPLVFLDCQHLICHDDIKQCVNEYYPNVSCPMNDCFHVLSRFELLEVFSPADLDEMDSKQLQQFLNSSRALSVKCQCNYSFLLEPGAMSTFTDENGVDVTGEALDHMSRYRYFCPSCQSNGCALCSASPYHVHRTCAQYQSFLSAPKCRFCSSPVSSSTSIFPCCDSADCLEKLRVVCPKVLPCGHPCSGCRENSHCFCLECLGTTEELCPLCMADPLCYSPCVQLDCGHVIHYECIFESLNRKWSGHYITFNFAKCPCCQSFITASFYPSICALMAPVLDLFNRVKGLALGRLQLEEVRDPRLSDPASECFNNPESFALERYIFYLCHRCSLPYYGGAKECEAALEDREVNPEELVGPCCIVPDGRNNCDVHGSEFIQYKCRFCCKIATFFCFGNTHFCEDCHKRPGDVQNLLKKKKLPPCLGATCPTAFRHPPPGEEHCFGCAKCFADQCPRFS